MEGYSISQVAQRFGIEPHTLRFYEKEGILHPARAKSGVRLYTEENLAQLEMVMCLKSTGMPLKEIKRDFDLVEQWDSTLEERLRILLSDREKAEKMGRNASKLLEEYRPEHVDRTWMDYLLSFLPPAK